jgi:uncharacterized protein (DUF305 family)
VVGFLVVVEGCGFMRFRVPCFVPLVVITLALGGCSGATNDSAKDSVAKSAENAAPTFNDADVSFAQNMIPHHQQAVEMAVIALDGARKPSAAVKGLAERIQQAQQPEIDLMTGWLNAWGKSAPASEDTMDHSQHGGMDGEGSMTGMAGMMSATEMKDLEGSSGASFDTAWMEMMVRHHEGAIEMAKTVQSAGANPDVKELAGKIVTAQEAEITEMKTILGL